MSISSIHFAAGGDGYFFHNDRSQKTVNSIFSDEENECSIDGTNAIALYRRVTAERVEKYEARVKQKMQSKTILHLSAIVNFEKHHTLQDLQRVANLLESRLGTRVFQIAMHRDEGHLDAKGNAVKNYHAHIEFAGLDQDGQSVRKKMTKKFLSDMQTDVAKILKMERGINYAREGKKRPKRLDTHEFKSAAANKAAAVADIKKRSLELINLERKKMSEVVKKANDESKTAQKQLKEAKAEIVLLMQAKNALRADYALLEANFREIKSQIAKNEINDTQLKAKIEQLKEELELSSSSKINFNKPPINELTEAIKIISTHTKLQEDDIFYAIDKKIPEKDILLKNLKVIQKSSNSDDLDDLDLNAPHILILASEHAYAINAKTVRRATNEDKSKINKIFDYVSRKASELLNSLKDVSSEWMQLSSDYNMRKVRKAQEDAKRHLIENEMRIKEEKKRQKKDSHFHFQR